MSGVKMEDEFAIGEVHFYTTIGGELAVDIKGVHLDSALKAANLAIDSYDKHKEQVIRFADITISQQEKIDLLRKALVKANMWLGFDREYDESPLHIEIKSVLKSTR